jgi:copper chaperone CopZ
MNTYTFYVENLAEAGSFTRIFRELSSIEGVNKVGINAEKSSVEVDIESGVSTSRLTKVLQFLGLKARQI